MLTGSPATSKQYIISKWTPTVYLLLPSPHNECMNESFLLCWNPSPGGYYLTSLYASLYYISSFRSRLAARQLSAEAQKSLSQWHRRRTLHCNQSRRSRNRRTIRRHRSTEKSDEESEEVNASNASKDNDQTHTADVTETLQSVTEIFGEEKEEEQNGWSEDWFWVTEE